MNDSIAVTARTLIKASKVKVWDALTNPDIIKEYFLGVNVQTNWEVGSQITYKGEWEGKAFEEKGTVLMNLENILLENNYWSPSFGEDIPENYVLVRYELEDNPDGTGLTVTQIGANDQVSADQSKQNWQTVLDKMKELLERQ